MSGAVSWSTESGAEQALRMSTDASVPPLHVRKIRNIGGTLLNGKHPQI